MTPTLEAFDGVVREVRALIAAKDHDYGSSWRMMRPSSITDQILVKVNRIRKLEELGGQGKVSEGIDSELRDILAYAAFELILRSEQRDKLPPTDFWIR